MPWELLLRLLLSWNSGWLELSSVLAFSVYLVAGVQFQGEEALDMGGVSLSLSGSSASEDIRCSFRDALL